VRSVRPIIAVLAVSTLSGCATTQQEAARLRLNSARLRASQFAVNVRRPDPEVRIEDVAIIAGRGGSALIVRMRSLTDHPLNDLPVSLGLIAHGGKRLYLNESAGMSYFETHVPVIAPRGALTWVFTTARRLSTTAHAFAEVGPPGPLLPLPRPRTLPSIIVTGVGGLRVPAGQDLRVSVRNPSSVPQYQLEVYAVARRRGRYAAAGEATIEDLGAGSSAELRLNLLGNPAGADVALDAPPTIFG
jgi:hypothetical protein